MTLTSNGSRIQANEVDSDFAKDEPTGEESSSSETRWDVQLKDYDNSDDNQYPYRSFQGRRHS